MGFRFSLCSEESIMDSFNAVKMLDPKTLDMKKVEFLSQHKDLLKKLDEWILLPDQKLLSHLTKLGKVVDTLYKFNDIVIYRGMTSGNLAGGYQEMMGLTEKTFFGGTKLKKTTVPGYKFDYQVKGPISFSWDEDIANAFGNIVVQSVTKKGQPRLIITDELAHLVSRMRNLKEDETQREVIMLPTCTISCKVLKV